MVVTVRRDAAVPARPSRTMTADGGIVVVRPSWNGTAVPANAEMAKSSPRISWSEPFSEVYDPMACQ